IRLGGLDLRLLNVRSGIAYCLLAPAHYICKIGAGIRAMVTSVIQLPVKDERGVVIALRCSLRQFSPDGFLIFQLTFPIG
ncbi:hypothetical protein C1X73_38635, partial [Pseudomonas sp. FW305-130]